MTVVGRAVAFLLASVALIQLVPRDGCAADAAPLKLRVGIATIYPPFAFKENGEITGVEAQFAEQLAKDLPAEVQVVEVPWDDLIPALRDRRIDVIMSGMSITPERSKLVRFTRPYLQIGQMVLIRAEDTSRLHAPGTMDQPSAKVGVHRNTTGEFYARRALKHATIKTYDSIDAGIAALRAKEIDFFVHDAPTIWRIRGREQEKYADLRGRYRLLTKESLAWAVRKDDTTLHDKLDAILEKWEDSGLVEDVLDKWIPFRKVAIEGKP